jgi:ABC-2 type transport system permease protein
MKIHRIKTVLLHSYFHLTHSKETWVDLFWMPLIQFVIFGFLSLIIAKTPGDIGQSLLLGFLFWQIVSTGQYCITISLLWEVWSRSLSTMFISPLTMTEWICGQATASLMKTLVVTTIITFLSAVLFHFSLLALSSMLIIYACILLVFSFAAGIFVTGLVLRLGIDFQSLGWALIYILQPISAVFYPVEILPPQVRWLAFFSPITYVMESARYQLKTGTILVNNILISVFLTAVYFALSVLFLQKMFHWSKKTGSFARLGN